MRPQYALAILIHVLLSLLLLAPGTAALVTIESDIPSPVDPAVGRSIRATQSRDDGLSPL